MPIPFEPTNSFCYRFSRYTLLPEIVALPAVQRGEQFRLIDLVKPIIDRHLTPEQQQATYLRAQTGKSESVLFTIKWYVRYLAKATKQLKPLGNGIYTLPAPEDIDQADAQDSAMEDGDPDDAITEGFIYAFTFPALIAPSGPFPIKVGMTVNDVEHRVIGQCRGSAIFENPRILGHWKVNRVGFVESAIHKVLAARGKWRESVPGTEWFDTTIEEIKSIIDFTTGQHS